MFRNEVMISAGRSINHLARLYLGALRKRIATLGVAPGQFPILMTLCEKDGLTQSELLTKLNVEQATLTNTLTRMERDQLVRRKPHATDARARIVLLTDRGRSVCVSAARAIEQLDHDMLADLSRDERRDFVGYLRRVKLGTAEAPGSDASGQLDEYPNWH